MGSRAPRPEALMFGFMGLGQEIYTPFPSSPHPPDPSQKNWRSSETATSSECPYLEMNYTILVIYHILLQSQEAMWMAGSAADMVAEILDAEAPGLRHTKRSGASLIPSSPKDHTIRRILHPWLKGPRQGMPESIIRRTLMLICSFGSPTFPRPTKASIFAVFNMMVLFMGHVETYRSACKLPRG